MIVHRLSSLLAGALLLLCSVLAFGQSDPQIYGMFPGSAPAGALVSASGAGFGSTQSGGTVTQNGSAVTIAYWSDTSVSFYLPANATTGPVVVTTSADVSSNAVSI